MIAVANRMRVKPEFALAFEERFANRAGLVDAMPGFLSNLVLKPSKPEDPYVILTFWQSREAFEAWTSSPAFQQGHSRSGSLPREAFEGQGQLEVHEVISMAGELGGLA